MATQRVSHIPIKCQSASFIKIYMYVIPEYVLLLICCPDHQRNQRPNHVVTVIKMRQFFRRDGEFRETV